jgi:hypothetical protein
MAITIRTASVLGGGASVPDATTTTKGKVRLATIAEAAGSSEAIAVTPAGLQAEIGGITGGLTYKGLWDAVNAVPDLSNALQGDFYKISAAGSRYGQDWEINDHLIINEDMGGSIVNSRIDKIDNTEQVAELNDLTDVTITSQASGEVLKYDGSAWVNAALTTSDVAGVATDADLTSLEARVTINEGDISSLEPRVTTNENNISAIQTEVDRIEQAAGISTSGAYIINTSSNYINNVSSLNAADVVLDQQIKVNADAIISSASSLQSEINAIETGAGLNSNGTYTPDATADYISAASSLKNADSLLDDKLKETRDLVDSLGASSVSSVNSISPVVGDVTVGGGDIDSAHTATNYTATSADLDGHLAGVDTALGLKANSASLATVATSGAYADLSGSPALATVATSGLYTDLSSLPTLGTAAALDVGTSANNVVQLNGSAQLPAVDGSQLTGIVADVSTASVGDLSDVTITSASANELLKFNGSAWVNASVAYSEVTGTPSLATVATSGSYADLSNTPTLGTASAQDVGTATGDVVQLVDVGGSPGLPVVDGSQLTGITADVSTASVGDLSDVTITSASSAQVLKYNGTAWVNSSVAYAEVTGTPSLATVATTGDYADLLNKPTLGTASAEDVGTTIGDVVQLEDVGGSAALPAVDGSQLTGLNIDSVGDLGDVTITTPAAGDALIYDDVSSEWQNQALATVATSGAYADLSGSPDLAPVATSGAYVDLFDKPTLGTASAEDVGTATGDVVQLVDVGGSPGLPVVDGSNLTGITADVSTASIGGLADVTITSAANGDALVYDGTKWRDLALATVATTGAYSDLTGKPTLGTASAQNVEAFAQTANNLSDLASASTARTNLGLGTASVLNVGTSANNVVQLNGSAQLPAVDGSLLTGITADVSTASIGALVDVTITSAANGDALVYDGTKWRDLALAAVATSGAASDVSGLATVATTGAYSDLTGAPALATVATTGDYDDLINAPTSMIGSAQFITDANALTLQAGKHYIIGTANATTKTMTLPDVTASGEYIRVTNWGDGQLVIQVDQVSSSAYLLVGNTIVPNGQVTIESRATVDLFGFDYTPAGYEPAWGVYFSSSIETNTRSFNTTGQLPVYDATKQELYAGDLGDLSLSFSATNYDETRGATVDGTKVIHHLGGIDDELGALDTALTTLDGEAVKSVNTLTPTAGAVVLGGADIETAHTASDYTAAASDLDSHLAGIDTRLAEKVNAADGLNGLDDVDLTTPATDGQILLFDGVSSTFKPGPPPAPVADETTLGLVELATDAEAQAATATDRAIVPSNLAALDLDTFSDVSYPSAPTDGQLLQWVNANSRWEPKTFVPAAPKVTSASPGSTYSITTHDGIEEVYLLTPSVDCTVSIPTATDAGSGFKYSVKNLSANVLTINATIDGTSGLELTNQYSAVTLVSDGSNWFII